MRRNSGLLPLLVPVVLATLSTCAAGQTPRAERQGRQARQGIQANRRGAQINVAQVPVALLDSLCKLTPEQKEKITAIQTKLETDLRALRPQRGAAPDPSAAQKRRDLNRQALSDVQALLTPAQLELLKPAIVELGALRSVGVPLEVIADLKLTDEQKKKIGEIVKETREKIQAMAPEERRAKQRELMTAARTKAQELLTTEQKTVIEKHLQRNRRQRQAPSP